MEYPEKHWEIMVSIPPTEVWAGHFTSVPGKIKCHPLLPCAMVRAGKLLYGNLKILK